MIFNIVTVNVYMKSASGQKLRDPTEDVKQQSCWVTEREELIPRT